MLRYASNRAFRSISLYQKLNKGFHFSWVETVLALSLLFLGPLTVCTMLAGNAKDFGMI